MQIIKNHKSLGLFHIIMINIIAVDSIRTLPFAASGFSLLFYYIVIGLCFFLPAALVVAELGTGWPQTGGIYVWVREAFGKKWSLISIWLSWIYNIVWYPTIIALIAGTATYLFNPSFQDNKIYMAISVVVIFGYPLCSTFSV
jgi:amino acid transporter